jgi:hypothetical protein
MTLRNAYGKAITEVETFVYILRLISEEKNEEQIVKIFNGDKQLVKTWIATLMEIHFITVNSFSKLVVTSEGNNYLQKFDLHL